MSCEHSHGHSHSHGGGDDDSHIPAVTTYTSQSLISRIDTSKVTALNVVNRQEEVAKLFKNSETRYEVKPVIKSDADEQIILHIPFTNSSIKLYSFILRSNGDLYCPKSIKLYKNDQTIDFDNVDQKKPTFTITHPHSGVMYNDDDDLPAQINDEDFVEHQLPRHKFAGLQHLTIFIDTIYGREEVTKLHSIELRGEFIELNKDPVISLYESAANPADHKLVQGLGQSSGYSIQ